MSCLLPIFVSQTNDHAMFDFFQEVLNNFHKFHAFDILAADFLLLHFIRSTNATGANQQKPLDKNCALPSVS